MIVDEITWLHVESTNKCNAWCPACSRNNRGFGLSAYIQQEQDLLTSRFIEIVDQLPNLKIVQLCGNYGDPIAGANILDLINACIEKKLKVQVHTNGSLRNVDWWADLGSKLANHPHDVWFGIDGIGETHEIYRQATSYNKIIENATAFINAGGHATWQFIPYEHNQHQIKQALKTSQQLNFAKFKMVRLFRNKKKARHWKTGQEFDLNPPSDVMQIVKVIEKNTLNLPPTDRDCMHKYPEPSIYVNSQGKLSWCCYRIDTMVESITELLKLPLDFNNKTCIINCGTKEKQ